MSEPNLVWHSTSATAPELTTLWADRILRIDDVWIHISALGGENHIFMDFTISRRGKRQFADPASVMQDWSDWFEHAGVAWALSDSAGSQFDDRVFDIYTRHDLDAIGGTIEAVGFMPEGLETGFEPEPWLWPPSDLEFVDVTLISGSKIPLTSLSPCQIEEESFSNSVSRPLTA